MNNFIAVDTYQFNVTSLRQRVSTNLRAILPVENLMPDRLHSAMRYVVLNGGKRLRPLLVYATGHSLGARFDQLDMTACAVELIHCYSLVHDDLPAMDNDDLRRGKPTCHKAYDEATAILVGDALQSLAFEILTLERDTLSEKVRLQLIRCLAQASGSIGMVGGQSLDLMAEGQKLDIVALERIHHKKTGALISACIEMGAIVAGYQEEAGLIALREYATLIGLAFQIKDDLLDVESSTEILGKTTGVDQAHQKATYPAILGIAKAKEKLTQTMEQAYTVLNALPGSMQALKKLNNLLWHRAF